MAPKIDTALITKLREITGLGMMDCKKALEESNGDIEKAIEILRKKGASIASKRSDKHMAEGIVATYIHPGAQIGVLVEVNCETDFVANTPDLKNFANDLCMHIAAARPHYLTPEEVDPALIEKEKAILKEQLAQSGKPAQVIDQIVQGKLTKLYSEICLMQQHFIKNDKFTIDQLLKELMGKTGENIRIKRFARYEIGT